MTFKAILPAGFLSYSCRNSFRRIIPTGVAIMISAVFAGNFANTVFATDSTISLTLSGEVVLNLSAADEAGTFGTSSAQTISITSNHYTGYTLSITGSDDNGQLVGAKDSSNYFSSITSEISESTFSSSTGYNNMWGFLPSKYNGSSNSSYLPAPTTTATVLDTTSAANSIANTYTLAVGARANVDTAKDSYSNTFIIAAVGNPAAYQVTYNSNTTATVSNLPSTTTGTLSGGSFTVSSTEPTNNNGLYFAGWCAGTATADSTTCSGTTVSAGGTYTLSTINQTALNTVTLYALWTDCPAGYICYDKNGADGTTAMANQSASASSSVTLRASNFSYTDHGFIGWSENPNAVVGTDTIYGGNEDITTPSTLSSYGLKLYAIWLEKDTTYTMQTFTSSICSANLTAATYDSSTGTITTYANSVIALEDERDGNVYAIARLTDGNCWMLENLRLDNTASLTASNTHNPSISALGTPSNYSDSTTWCKDSNSTCYDQSMLDTTNTINTSTTTTTINDVAYSYGNYYNWYSETAGNGTYSGSSGTVSGDICPSNWKLPMGSSSNGTTSGSFGYLSSSMGGLYNTTMNNYTTPTGATMSARLRSFPNNFLYSGFRRYSDVYGRGSNSGVYRSSTSLGSTLVYELSFSSSYVGPGTYQAYKYQGFPVRCLAGS